MNFNNNFPVGFQPYQMPYLPYPQSQQNYTQQMQSQSQQPQTGGMIFVNNQKEAEDWLVQRGETVVLWDKNRPVFYIRAVDNRGLPLPIEVKEYKDFIQTVQIPKFSNQKEPDLKNYVTNEEFEKRIGELNKQIFDLMSESSNKKGEDDGKQLIV